MSSTFKNILSVLGFNDGKRIARDAVNEKIDTEAEANIPRSEIHASCGFINFLSRCSIPQHRE